LLCLRVLVCSLPHRLIYTFLPSTRNLRQKHTGSQRRAQHYVSQVISAFRLYIPDPTVTIRPPAARTTLLMHPMSITGMNYPEPHRYLRDGERKWHESLAHTSWYGLWPTNHTSKRQGSVCIMVSDQIPQRRWHWLSEADVSSVRVK
jgi:hypothetical protein